MSEEFHVHGAHDHALEHAAESGHADSFAGRIAVMTAILSTAGAIFGYQGGATQNAALLAKNEAAIHKTEAANRWAYYQAKGQKQAIAELTAQLPGTDQAAARREAQRYAAEKEDIRRQAEDQELGQRGRRRQRARRAPSSSVGASGGRHSGVDRAGGYHVAFPPALDAGTFVRCRRCRWCRGRAGAASHLTASGALFVR
jgi:hypothetical protein